MPSYWFHFVGRGLYGTRRFIAEARRLGVSRAISWASLVKLAEDGWGTPVLLAEYRRVQEGDQEAEGAVVFGYFYVRGLNIPQTVSEKLLPKLNISAYQGGGGVVHRLCGSYSIGGSYVVEDSLKELVGKIREACRELGVNPVRLNVFVTGQLHLLPSPVILRGQKFFRGFRKVQIEGLDLSKVDVEPYLTFIYDYQRRRYLPKEERDRFDHLLLDEWLRQDVQMPEPR